MPYLKFKYHNDTEFRKKCLEANKKWKAKNKDKTKEYGKRNDIKRQYKPERIKQRNESGTRLRIRQKLLAIKRYGGKCVYCGESRYELLSVDHINNNGSEHRKIRSTKKSIWDILAYQEYQPKEYQILCFNCNTAKQLFGIMPKGNNYQPISYWEQLGAIRQKQRHKHKVEIPRYSI